MKVWLLVVFLVCLNFPVFLEACSVCFSATDENRMAFLYTTAFLSLSPLILLGTVIYFYFKKGKIK